MYSVASKACAGSVFVEELARLKVLIDVILALTRTEYFAGIKKYID